MPAVASPVRDPAWQVSRGAIGLWVTEGIIGAVVLGLGAGRSSCSCRPSWADPFPSCAGRCRSLVVVDAVVSIGVRPRLRYRVHRWEVTDEAVYTLTGWLSRTWTLVPISRIQTVDVTRGRDAAAVRAGVRRGADGVVARARSGCRTSRPTSPSAWPTTWRGGRRRSATRPRDRRPPGRRTSAAGSCSCTPITFRQARQFVPALIPLVAATGFGGGRTTSSSCWPSASPCSRCSRATLSWWRFSYADGPSAVVVTRGLLSRSVRTVPTDRIRGVEVETPLVHRLFGLVRVRIDAAAGAVERQRTRRWSSTACPAPRATACAPPS